MNTKANEPGADSRINSLLGYLEMGQRNGRIARRSVENALAMFGTVEIERQDRNVGGRMGFSRWHIKFNGSMFNGDTLLDAFEDAVYSIESSSDPNQ